MPLFRLERYPYVCRLCLKPEQHRKMTSLDTEDDALEGTSFEDFLATFTFEVEEEKRHLFPRSICAPCRDLLRAFGRFHAKVRKVHLFMNALVELRTLNTGPLRSLFATPTERSSTRAMLLELGLCHGDQQVEANDLIDEFPQFKVASLPVSVRNGWLDPHPGEEFPPEDVGDVVVKEEEQVSEEDVLFAEECSPEELNELTEAGKVETAVAEDFSVKPASMVQWEFLDDSDEEMELPEKIPSWKRTLVKNATTVKKKPTAQYRKIDWDSWIANPPTTVEGLKDRLSEFPSNITGRVKAAEPLQCPKCPYNTNYKTNYHHHQLRHLKREHCRYACKVPGCSADFQDRRHLAAHVEKKHRTWICEICGQNLTSRNTLEMHKKRSHSDASRSFNCQYCPKSFKVQHDLRVHTQNIHLAARVFKCETCGLEFKRKCTLEIHRITHTNEYNFPCKQCDKKFQNNNALKKHVSRAHQEPGFDCEHCSKQFYTRGSLLDHIEHVHGIQMRFTCDICVATFDSQDKLASHKDCHENPKMFQCGRCLLVFSAQEPFSDHLCITYRDDYICCGRDFRDHQPYNRHVFLRHGTKVNARVRPEPGVLLGQLRARRKRLEICQKCDACFATRILKKKHQETCLAGGD